MQALSLLFLGLSALLTPPQDPRATAELFVRPAPAPAEAGELRAAIRIRIEDGWHLYHDELGQPDSVGKATQVSFQGADGTWSSVRFPKPLRLEQPGIGEGGRDTWIWGHEGEIVLYAAGRLAAGADASALEAKLSGLTCQDDGSCIPWSERPRNSGAGPDALFAAFPADLQVGSSEAAPNSAKSKPPVLELPGKRGTTLPGFDSSKKASAKLFVRAEAERVRLAVEITIEEGWHLYHDDKGPPDAVGRPTSIVPGPPEGITWGRPIFPEPKRLEQPGVGDGGRDTWIWGHEGTIVVHVEGRVAAGVDGQGVWVDIDGLTCQDDGSCLPWATHVVSGGEGPDSAFENFPAEAASTIGTAAVRTPDDAEESYDAGTSYDAGVHDWDAVSYPAYEPRGASTERSLALWLCFAFIAGVLLNVMPCVLPVVSIKILSFVQQAGESRARIFQLGLAFSAGILAVFVALAALAALGGKGWGEQFQSQTFLVVMIAIVFAFALSLFDVFEVGVPQQVGQMAAQRREGVGDAFFKGMMATVLATPCSGPFLGSTLAWALTQPATVVFSIFLFVGLGMAAPYVLLTANPGFLKFVPKPGAWMQTFKHLMGFLLLGTVIFLMVSLRQDLHVYMVAFLVFVALACWIWGRYATFDQSGLRRVGTVIAVLLVLAGGARASFVTLRNFFAGPGEGAGHLVWEDFDPEKLQRYHEQGRSVFVDFTADWCLTCKTNEKLVYESDEIVALLADKCVVAMRADETEDNPKTAAIRRLRESLGARSIPFMAIFAGDDWQRPYTLKDLVSKGQVRDILEACPTPLEGCR